MFTATYYQHRRNLKLLFLKAYPKQEEWREHEKKDEKNRYKEKKIKKQEDHGGIAVAIIGLWLSMP
jgi:hypothetical protein